MGSGRTSSERHDLGSLRGRLWAYAVLHFDDHGILRVFWSHMYEIAPGVWRSNQPSPARIRRWARQGIRAVLTLRGRDTRASHLLEAEACAAAGLTLHSGRLPGGVLVPREPLLELLDQFRAIERPFVFHCKSGIDRTGLAAFLYLLAETDTPPEIARRQLSFKYLHLKGRRHGILDLMADNYLAAYRESGIGIRDWIATGYDPEALTRAYRRQG